MHSMEHTVLILKITPNFIIVINVVSNISFTLRKFGVDTYYGKFTTLIYPW